MSPAFSWDDLLNEAESSGTTSFEPLPQGPYDFVITEASVGQTKTEKKKYTITAEVESGPYAKRKVWNDFVLSPDSGKALSFFFQHMAVLGLDKSFFGARPSDEQIVAALRGKRFIGGVVQREWNGKIKNELDTFSTPRAGLPGPSSVPAAPVSALPAPAALPAPVSLPAAPIAAPAPVAPAPVAAPAPAPAAVPDPPAVQVDPWDGATPAANVPAPAPAPAPAPQVATAPAPPAPPF